MYKDAKKEISEGYKLTTNNRMEILSVIKALSLLKEPCCVSLYSDSQYVINAINKNWLNNWRKNGWKRKDGILLNADLWKNLYEIISIHTIKFIWVKGHAANEFNERCDELARSAANASQLLTDEGYIAVDSV
jgi:ribonuclease HI